MNNTSQPSTPISNAARRNHDELLPNHTSTFPQTDPEFIALFDNFAFDEVIAHDDLPVKTRIIVILAATLGAQALTEYKVMMGAGMNVGITPIELKEILYQAVPYVGVAKALDFLVATNDFLVSQGVELPLEGQATTDPTSRYEKGLAVQKEIFGDAIEAMYEKTPEDQVHIQRYLSANCFGDYYTRSGLELKTRELITLSILIALGGTESQIKGQIQGNINLGNDRALLVSVITQLLPYVGYPRTLTALTCLNDVVKV